MTPYTISEIREVLQAEWLQCKQADARIETLLTDSRKLSQTQHALFIAIHGKRHNAHRHLSEVYGAGVRHFLVSEKIGLEHFPEANFILVKDTLASLQKLAGWHRMHFHYPVIGITGSNGKTVIKEWLAQLLNPDKYLVKSPKSYNSQLGVPLSVWKMDARHELAIFEAGISEPGEMERLEAMIRPEIGVFTNIGAAHQQGFASEEEKVREKMRLFEHSKVLICNVDYSTIRSQAEQWAAFDAERQLLSWSFGTNAAIQVELEKDHHSMLHFSGRYTARIELPFLDDASIENGIHACILLLYLGYDSATIQSRVFRLEPVEMRLELKHAIGNCTLVNDSYNSDIDSLRIALQFAQQQAQERPVILILSDILQSGEPEAQLYARVAALLEAHGVERIIGIGDSVSAVQAHLPASIQSGFYPSTDAFLADISRHPFQDALILVKGARPFAFERVVTRLEQKIHQTVLEVDLDALVHNLNLYHQRLSKGTQMMVMIKAEAYGSGPAELARLLAFHKVDYFGVAYPDEGVALRHAGVQLPVLVLNADASSFDTLYRYQLEPEIYKLDQLRALARYAHGEKEMPIHIKLDTGMHRLGFEATHIPELVQVLSENPNLKVASVFSHLAASDNPVHDGFTHAQAARFQSEYQMLAEGLGYKPFRHLVNTGGIVRFPEYHFEMVRLGIGLYGVDGSGLQSRLRTVNALKTQISQIREVEAGETVGYNRNGPVSKRTRVATIGIGYADGFLRLAGNGRFSVRVHGKKAPTIGNICMDMSMIDISHIPEAQEGDEVLVFGPGHSVQELADALQTIPYEVFTNVADRVKRVYKQG
jgi:alanine racemase